MTPDESPTTPERVEIDAALLAELRRDQHLLKFFLEKTPDHVYFKNLKAASFAPRRRTPSASGSRAPTRR